MSNIDSNKGDFIIENRNDEWWIAEWSGDPGRTLKVENAKRYRTIAGANRAITYFKKRFEYRKMELSVEHFEITKKRIDNIANTSNEKDTK